MSYYRIDRYGRWVCWEGRAASAIEALDAYAQEAGYSSWADAVGRLPSDQLAGLVVRREVETDTGNRWIEEVTTP